MAESYMFFLSQVGEAKKILFDMFALNLIHISIQLCTFETTSPPLQAKRKHGVPHMRLLTFLLHAIGLCCSDARPRPQFRVQYMSFYFTRVRFLNIISLGTGPIWGHFSSRFPRTILDPFLYWPSFDWSRYAPSHPQTLPVKSSPMWGCRITNQ